MSKQRIFGYARVSSKDQNLDRQLDALAQFPVDPEFIFADKASGKDFQRPAYQRLMSALQPQDVLVVKSIDRLGRNYDEILEEWRHLTREKDVSVVVLDMPLLDTRQQMDGITGVFLADLLLQLLSYVAQIEREEIRQRQAEGIAAAHARGVRFGRPHVQRPGNYSEIMRLYTTGQITQKEAARKSGVCVTTFAKWAKEDSAIA